MAQKKKEKKKFDIKKFVISLLVTIAVLASVAVLVYFSREIISFGQTIVAEKQAEKGNYDSAVEIYRYAIKFSRKKDVPFIKLGQLYESHGETDTALRVYEAGFEANASAALLENINRINAAKTIPDVKPVIKEEDEKKDYIKTLSVETSDSFVLSTYSYDTFGNTSLIVKTNSNGDFVGRSEYSHDEEGNLNQSAEYELQFSKNREYSEGMIIRETGMYTGRDRKKASIEEISDKGIVTMSRDGNYTVTYSYNTGGLVTAVEIVTEAGTENITYEYLKNNQLKSKTDNAVVTSYEYDKSGRLISETTELSDDKKVEILYSYYADKPEKCELKTINDLIKVTVETVDSRNRKKTEEVWQSDSFKEEYYDFDDDALHAKRYYTDTFYSSSNTYYYDKDGYIEKDVFYREEEPAVCYVDSYSYDKNHRLLIKDTYYPGKNVEYFDRYEYNSEGQVSAVLSKKAGPDGGASVDIYVAYVYDEEGNVIEENEYRINSKEIQVVSVNENEEGKEVRTEEYDSFGVNTASTIVFYDLDGRIEKEIITNPVTSVLESFRENKYDSKGRLSETVLYGENAGMKEHLFYVYDDLGRIDYVYSAKNDTNRKVEEYTYNDQGLLVSKKVTGGDIVYNYDKNGRLTVETFTEPFKGTVVSKTKYSY